MKITFAAFVTFAFAATSLSSLAQVLTPSTYLTDDSQILTTGTEVWGGRTVGGGPITLSNGVSLSTVFAGGPTYAASTIPGSTVSVRTDGAYRGDYTGEGGFSDSALNTALLYDFTGSYGQFYVAGLTPGNTYVIQLFATMTSSGDLGFAGAPTDYMGTETVKDNTPGGTGASTVLNWGQAVAGTGTGTYFITDTFTANATGQEFLDVNIVTGPQTQMAAAQIRDITAVPEPSTYAMMLACLGALVWIVRRPDPARR